MQGFCNRVFLHYSITTFTQVKYLNISTTTGLGQVVFQYINTVWFLGLHVNYLGSFHLYYAVVTAPDGNLKVTGASKQLNPAIVIVTQTVSL